MVTSTIRADIQCFLKQHSGRWFSSVEIAEAIGRKGKLITTQLDAATGSHGNIFCDRVKLKHQKLHRLYYGWFKDKKQAIAILPPVPVSERSIY